MSEDQQKFYYDRTDAAEEVAYGYGVDSLGARLMARALVISALPGVDAGVLVSLGLQMRGDELRQAVDSLQQAEGELWPGYVDDAPVGRHATQPR